jgi:hypothetical protein
MNYKLELQKIRIKVNQEKEGGLKKKLINQAIEIADKYKDLYEGLDLRHLLMEGEVDPDNRIAILKDSIQLSDFENNLKESFDLRLQLIQE